MDTTAPAMPAGETPIGIATQYAARVGGTDEMVGPDGTIRPLWQPLIERLDSFAAHGIDTRFARADRYLRDAGVYFRAYGEHGSDPREWPLAHVPLLIDETEWQGIAAGLVQRARLLESVVADIYGDNRLVAEGLLPPELIAASPEYLRPMAGASGQGHFLHFLAFELGRGPDGRWWVLGDRTQAPSGAGFAIENRVATGRAFGDLMTTMNVHRLAGFFRDLRAALFSLAHQDGGVAILTPGLHNETYFEHAYIARYLGLMLLEGGDLTVSDGRVMVRTVEGPKPLRVLWRRLDSAFTDPLELGRESRIGTPGLVEAVRRGGAVVVNAIGSGILETRALLAFLPGISKRLNGEELALPHIATWWCGGDREREHVLANLDRMMIAPALTTALPFHGRDDTILPASLDAANRAALAERLAANGGDFVAQESVGLSTMPYYAGGRLEPRPVTMRAFAMRTPHGWKVMPGGFARVGASPDASVVAMQQGGRAADVWIIGHAPVEQVTLLPDGDDTTGVRLSALLPSRAADNLFWLGRYIERADGLARVLRAYQARLADDPDTRSPVMPVILAALKQISIEEDSGPIPAALLDSIDAARDSAGRIRDRFSPDGWLALQDLSKTVHRFDGVVTPGDDAARAMTVLLRKLAGFAGLAHENMYHSAGWRFLEMGRRLERALEMARLMVHFAGPDQPAELVDLLVEIGDSVMTQRRLYRVNSGRLAAIELLALDDTNPRSILFQLAGIKEQVAILPGDRLNPVMREALRLHTALAISAARDVTPEMLVALGNDLAGLSDAIDGVYFR